MIATLLFAHAAIAGTWRLPGAQLRLPFAPAQLADAASVAATGRP